MSTDRGLDKGVDNGVRILSLDSGGPGTYSQLLIIKEYMVRLANDLGMDEADVYPADYFDLMGGVGFGGLVAILLGHLRMNVDEAIDALLDVALAIFPDEASPQSDLEKNAKHLRQSIENILQTRGIPATRKMQEKGEEPIGCKVALYAATTANLSHPIVLRTYKPRGSSLNPTIVEAIGATMATPSYFSPINIGPRGRQQTFVGGPHGVNNPTRELLREANAVFGKEKLVMQVVSLGCGRSRVPSMDTFTDTDGVCRLVQEMAADCEIVEKELSARLYDIDAYLRLNVDRGMEKLLMREWHQLGPIETHTNAYVESPSISETFEASLRRLQEGAGTVTLGQINHPSTTKDVQDTFNKHKDDLESVVQSMRDSEDFRVLERLNPVGTAGYSEDRSCMEGTRTALLEHLVDWSSKPSPLPNTANMHWLYGSPGLGKTSIANSLCDRLHGSKTLGGSFFCRRDDPILSDPRRILPTLVAKLAGMSAPYKRLVAKALSNDPQLNPQSRKGEVLLSLLQSVKKIPPHPLVLVIDAFDECGDPITRKELLTFLFETCSLVSWIIIIITSRPEHDIERFFEQNQVDRRDLAEDKEAADDIWLFTRRRMASIASRHYLPTDWPGAERLKLLSDRSGGLFIYMETVLRLLDDPDPEPLLSKVLGEESGEANTELDKLYSTAILSRIGKNKEKFRLLAQAIVTVAKYRPLPDKTLASLMGLEPGVVRSWVDRLGSILYRDASTNGGIRVRHLSVLDFLTSPACPEEFRVVLGQANEEMGVHCLTAMAKELKFNICELDTSCVLNADIPDLDNRVQDKISDTLQYSSMHWSSHLCSDSAPASMAVSKKLNAFLRGAQQLYWVEVLSLMGKTPVAISSMRLMKACFKKFEDEHRRLVDDALRFLLAFFTPISTSTPHLYLSALPFTPMESDVCKHARVSFPEVIDVCKGRAKSWPAPSSIWLGHTDYVQSVAYSPDGVNVVSGSYDHTIRIWDAETGAAVGQPLIGHTRGVRSVAYSPDGQNVVSGSSDNTIRIWDAQTGAAVGQPLTGHAGAILSVRYSPDGQNVVSSSNDNTIRIWDVQTGAAVGQPLTGHTGWVHSAAYSPDGQSVVSGSDDYTIRIWDAQTGAAIGHPLTGHTGGVHSVAYSPNGQKIISGSSDYTIRIWDAQTGAAVGQPLTGHTGGVRSVVYSPDGQNIVSGSSDNMIQIWDAQTGAAVGQPLTGHTGWVSSVAYSPDGQNVVSGSNDNMVRIWDAQTGAVIGHPLIGHTGWFYSVTYSPDGRNVISGSNDNTVRIWDAKTGAAVGQPLTGHTGGVRSVAYSPDGQKIVSGSSDDTIRIWDVQTGATIGHPLIGHTGLVYSIAYSPDGVNVVSGSYDHTIRIWDAETGAAVGQPLIGHAGGVRSVAYSPDGQKIVSGSSDYTIRIWDAQTGAAIGHPLMGHTGYVYSATYSPDGQNIVSSSEDHTVRIWDAQTGAAVCQPLTGHGGGIRSVAYSPNGQNVISGSYDYTIRIWDAQTGAAVGQPLTGHAGAILRAAYSPDGQNIISGSNDNTIRIWDAQTGTAVGQPLTGRTGGVRSVAYSPDGQNVVSGSYDNMIRTWDARTGAAVGQPLTGHTGWVYSVAYSPDGLNIVSGSNDNTIRTWDMQTGAEVGQPLTGHTGAILSVAYSPDGVNVVSGSYDHTIRIWDAETGAAVGQPLTGHTGGVWGVAYSPDGQKIVSGSSDSTIRIWDAQTGAVVGQPLTGHFGWVSSVAYSPDGQNVASGSYDNTIRIWDTQTGAAVGQPLTGHTGRVYSVAYSPDGHNVVSGSDDDTIRIWDTQTGVAVGQSLTGHTWAVWSVAYSPGGYHVVSGSDDNTIRIWDAQTGMDENPHIVASHSSHPSTDNLSLTAFSGRPIPKTWLGIDGWVRDAEGLLFWVPDDFRHGLTCPAILTIPHTGRLRSVRIDFTRFQYGTSWTNICGAVRGVDQSSISSV